MVDAGFGFEVSGFGFKVSGFRFWVYSFAVLFAVPLWFKKQV